MPASNGFQAVFMVTPSRDYSRDYSTIVISDARHYPVKSGVGFKAPGREEEGVLAADVALKMILGNCNLLFVEQRLAFFAQPHNPISFDIRKIDRQPDRTKTVNLTAPKPST